MNTQRDETSHKVKWSNCQQSKVVKAKKMVYSLPTEMVERRKFRSMRQVLRAAKRGIWSLACFAPSTYKRVAQLTEGNPQRFAQAADVTNATPAIYSAGVYMTIKFAPIRAGCGRDPTRN